MFTTISWHQYFIFLGISTCLYYLVIYLLYFRNTAGLPVQQRQDSFNGNSTGNEPIPTLFDHGSNHEDSLQPILYACMNELNAFFENGKKTKVVKREVMFALHSILQKYPSLKNSEYRQSITNVIATECENICSIHLSAEELKDVWLGE